jgi:hypothetical protein
VDKAWRETRGGDAHDQGRRGGAKSRAGWQSSDAVRKRRRGGKRVGERGGQAKGTTTSGGRTKRDDGMREDGRQNKGRPLVNYIVVEMESAGISVHYRTSTSVCFNDVIKRNMTIGNSR